MEKRHRQPLAVTLTAYGVFLLGAGYLLQSGQALTRYSLLHQLPLSVPAWYPPSVGALWGGLWLALAVGLWRRREWSRRFTLIALPLQLVFWLGDWWIFSRSAIAIQSFGFELGLRLLASALAAAILLLSGRWEAGRRGERAAESTERETAQSHGE